MGTLSIWHWLIVLLVIVLIFGTSKLRGIGKDLGGAIKDFKKGMNDEDKAPAKIEQTTSNVAASSVDAKNTINQ